MQYVAIINGQERLVDIVEVAPEHYQITVDGRVMEVDARAINETTLSLLIDDRAYNIEWERSPEGAQNLQVRGQVVLGVDVLDLRKVRLRRVQEAGAGLDGPATVTSPMPGKVVALLVKDGDTVEVGQGVIVVEAMKMENELKAPRAGKVVGLKVKEGEAVDGGATLCSIE